MSSSSNSFSPFKNLKADIPASIVVFLVAVPLCLGIALASGAPLFSGLIAGMIGGIVVGSLSGASLGVSGPAAGLAVIVLGAIQDLGFEIFLVAVVLSGIIQLILGFARGGVIAYYFPTSVIMGMLAGIGIIIFLKQIPHAFGYDRDPEGEMAFFQQDGENTFSALWNMIDFVTPAAVLIMLVSLAILLLWETSFMKKQSFTRILPGPLVAVTAGILLNIGLASFPSYVLSQEHLVTIPVAESMDGFFTNFTFPDFKAVSNPQVYIVALILAVVASLETLLSVEAIDKLDPHKRVTPTNRELKAQGVGNMLSGLIGGLPVTQVIVRSSANVQSGGKTKASAVIHGFLILFSIILIPTVLNLIPLATLAAVLMVVGYKLAKPAVFKKMYRQGMGQFVPFLVTILGIVFTDLLIGLAIGLAVSVIIILYNNFQIPYKIRKENLQGRDKIRIELAQEVTFLNKASILQSLSHIPENSTVVIDASNTYYMHQDVLEIIEDFKIRAKEQNIHLTIVDLYKHKEIHPPHHLTVSYDEDEERKPAVQVIEPDKSR